MLKNTALSVLFFVYCTLNQASTTQPDQHGTNILSPDQLSLRNIMEDIFLNHGHVDGFTLHNLDYLAAFLQGIPQNCMKLNYDIKPIMILRGIRLDPSDKQKLQQCLDALPMLPNDIREIESPLMLQMFVFVGQAFSKNHHAYIYATRHAHVSEIEYYPMLPPILLGTYVQTKIEKHNQLFSYLKYLSREENRISLMLDYKKRPDTECSITHYFNSYEHYFQYFADHGISQAALIYGLMTLTTGQKTIRNAVALQYFNQAAHAHIPHAEYYMGYMHAHGYGTKRNKDKAFEYFQRAASKGDACANYEMALLLEKGEGCIIDQEKAYDCFQRAADLGLCQAQYILAIRWMRGQTCPERKAKALAYLEKAADQDYTLAQYHMGLIMYYGKGVDINKPQAMVYLEKAARKGSIDAQILLHEICPQLWP